jgi:hypothetical protein
LLLGRRVSVSRTDDVGSLKNAIHIDRRESSKPVDDPRKW